MIIPGKRKVFKVSISISVPKLDLNDCIFSNCFFVYFEIYRNYIDIFEPRGKRHLWARTVSYTTNYVFYLASFVLASRVLSLPTRRWVLGNLPLAVHTWNKQSEALSLVENRRATGLWLVGVMEEWNLGQNVPYLGHLLPNRLIYLGIRWNIDEAIYALNSFMSLCSPPLSFIIFVQVWYFNSAALAWKYLF